MNKKQINFWLSVLLIFFTIRQVLLYYDFLGALFFLILTLAVLNNRNI
tara:strand:- start:3737 stop:3880 length:144 start_codon:yes stop_codon:yes gene_type:complete